MTPERTLMLICRALGAAAVGYGLFLLSIPLAWVWGGVVLLYLGWPD